jgi:hypothetical protein
MEVVMTRRLVPILLVSSLLLSSPVISRAATPGDTRTVILRGAGPYSPRNEIRNAAFHLLAAILAEEGIGVADSASWSVILEAILAGGGTDTLVAVSLTYARALPEEMVAFARKNEIMYAPMPAEKKAALPADGKWVREMVSEEFARSYVNPVGGEMFVVPRRDLERRFREAVKRFREVELGPQAR